MRVSTDRGLLGAALVSFAALAVAFSLRASLGLVIPVWQHDFGWSRSFISAVGALALIVAGLTALVAGIAVDRIGARAVLIAGLATAAIGAIATALARDAAGVVIGYGVIAAVSFGLVGNHVVATGIARLANEGRGFAISLAVAGSTAGQLALMPLLAVVTQAFAWRASFLVSAALAMALLPILAWTFGGGRAPSTASSAAPAKRLPEDLRELLASPTFQVLFWSYLLCGYMTTGAVETHFLPFTAVCGFAPLPSATAYGVLSFCKLLGMLACGWLSDRVSRPLLL